MKKLIFLIIFAIMILSLQGCGNSSGNGGGNGLKNEKVENYSVKIVYDGTEIKSYSIDEIKKMPTTNFELDGSTENGPSISYVLKETNIKDYSKITFIGMWKDSVTMTKEQIEKGCLLDITNHGTTKLASKAITKDKWIKDIATIKVEK